MENEFFANTGNPPQTLHFESTPSLPTWQQLISSAMEEIQPNSELNSSSDYSELNPNSDKVSIHYDSIFSNNISNGSFLIRELIGKLGNSSPPPAPKMNFPIRESIQSVETPMPAPLTSTSVEVFSADPGFAVRAARFSRFGSRSFDGRTTTGFGSNNSELSLPYGSYPIMADSGKLTRVSSTPSLQALGSNSNTCREQSTLSEQIPEGGETTSLKYSNDLNSRKRKGVHKGKVKELISPSPSANLTKVGEVDDTSSAKKRYKASDQNQKGMKAEENSGPAAEDEKDEETKSNPKPLEAPKDYIHVRARRGQATDSHSLAERVRREKISERMKVLQDIVPGCNKVTGKALMLDEIINYVQSLQHQVEFLSMKLASVNTNLDCNGDALLIPKEFHQSSNPSLPCLDPTPSSSFYSHQSWPNPPLQKAILNGQTANCSVFDPLDAAAVHDNHPMQVLPQINRFTTASASQYTKFGEDDLQSIVQMGFGQQ